MSCACKTKKVKVDEKSTDTLNSNNLNPMKYVYDQNILIRLFFFCLSVPLVIIMLPLIYLLLFNHFILGNSTDVFKLFKKIFLIDWILKINEKIKEKRRLKREIEENENPEDYEEDEFYITPIDKIDSQENK